MALKSLAKSMDIILTVARAWRIKPGFLNTSDFLNISDYLHTNEGTCTSTPVPLANPWAPFRLRAI